MGKDLPVIVAIFHIKNVERSRNTAEMKRVWSVCDFLLIRKGIVRFILDDYYIMHDVRCYCIICDSDGRCKFSL